MTPLLNDNVLSKMSTLDRKKLGKAGKLSSEIATTQEIKSEKELQRQCVAMLRLRGIEPLVSRFDKKTRGTVGWPDITFSILAPNDTIGIPCCFECKLPGQKPRPEQVEMMKRLIANGWWVRTIHSAEEMLAALHELEQ